MSKVTPQPKIGFVSLGCPKNLVDSERILTELRTEGYDVVPSYDDADMVIVNTCGFIDSAVQESLEAIDEVLMKVVKILKSQIPVDKGKVYRFGGDEFAVIYTGGTLEELLSILKEIVHFQVGSINLSTSIGVAHSNECPTVERLKMLADERLYKSKKNGRAQISWQ